MALSPSLYWRLNEPTPGTGSAIDFSGNGRNGTYVGSPPSVGSIVPSGGDPAVRFDGVGMWITSTYNPFVIGGKLSFQHWLRRGSNTTNDVIFGGSQASTQPFFSAPLTADTIQFFTSAGAAGQTWAGTLCPVQSIIHLVLTFDGTSKVSELFVNAISQGTKTHSTDFDVTPGNFNLCKRSASSDPGDWTQSHVAIFPSILLPNQVQTLYYSGRETVFIPRRMPLGV
jgi:hypothetical protein